MHFLYYILAVDLLSLNNPGSSRLNKVLIFFVENKKRKTSNQFVTFKNCY